MDNKRDVEGAIDERRWNFIFRVIPAVLAGYWLSKEKCQERSVFVDFKDVLHPLEWNWYALC